jgi:cytoskeletal protein CcmA (bactofilin family)
VIGENLVVGPAGRVKANLVVGHLVVEGAVEGTVRATEAVEIRQSGRLRGEVETPSLFIDRGVVFEGHCRVIEPRPGAGKDSS